MRVWYNQSISIFPSCDIHFPSISQVDLMNRDKGEFRETEGSETNRLLLTNRCGRGLRISSKYWWIHLDVISNSIHTWDLALLCFHYIILLEWMDYQNPISLHSYSHYGQHNGFGCASDILLHGMIFCYYPISYRYKTTNNMYLQSSSPAVHFLTAALVGFQPNALQISATCVLCILPSPTLSNILKVSL